MEWLKNNGKQVSILAFFMFGVIGLIVVIYILITLLPQGDPQIVVMAAHRITSYNVCYTKLLRDVNTFSRRIGEKDTHRRGIINRSKTTFALAQGFHHLFVVGNIAG